MLGQYVESVPAQQRLGPQWYQGSADAQGNPVDYQGNQMGSDTITVTSTMPVSDPNSSRRSRTATA